jgi:hypothetical protein
MRRYVTAFLAAALLAPAAAEAAPKPACTHVMTDARHDTYEGFGNARDEPGADITALDLRSNATTLTVVTTLADVDAPVATAPLGRSIWVQFRIREKGFLAKHVQAVDRSYGSLSVSTVDQGAGNNRASASAWTGVKVGEVPYVVDAVRNQVRLEIPLTLLREHAGALGKAEKVTVSDVSTYDVEGLSEYHSGGTIDTSFPAYGTWRLGSRGCA